MARIPIDPPTTVTGRLADWYARRSYGRQMDPLRAMAHNTKVLKADARWEMRIAKFDQAPEGLKHLAVMAAAVAVGCPWCVDFGYWLTVSAGMDARKMTDVPRWRDSDAYTDLERAVLEYAEAASQTPIAVTDEMVARLREDLTEGQLVELTMMIAVENQRSRFNGALGIASQGFKESCAVPVQG